MIPKSYASSYYSDRNYHEPKVLRGDMGVYNKYLQGLQVENMK